MLHELTAHNCSVLNAKQSRRWMQPLRIEQAGSTYGQCSSLHKQNAVQYFLYIRTCFCVCILLHKTVPGHSITIIYNIHCFFSQSIRTVCNGTDSHSSEIKCDSKKEQIQNQHDQIFHTSCDPTDSLNFSRFISILH